MKVTNDAIQILGGYGDMKEYLAERMMRDAKTVQIYEKGEPDPATRSRKRCAERPSQKKSPDFLSLLF